MEKWRWSSVARPVPASSGICGEHGGDPTSVEFLPQIGLVCFLLAFQRAHRKASRPRRRISVTEGDQIRVKNGLKTHILY